MMFRNDYVSTSIPTPKDIHLHTPPEDYDFNYACEVKTLQSDRVELRPYTPSLHAQLLYEGIKANPDVFRWLGAPVWNDLQDCLQWSERMCRAPSDSLFYAIFTDIPNRHDAHERVFAGVLGMISTNPSSMVSEPGWILIMPEFQRTHVLTHAAGLVMHRILDPPSSGGLGFRRCQWTTTTLNTRSQNAALRLGFKYEGVIRGNRILPPGKEACREGRPDSYQADWGVRDDWFASVMWYEWEDGVKEHVDRLMDRR